MLHLENVKKSFGGVVATNDVTLDFPAGSLSAVIGPNGAGKTTLFNLITGHLKPDTGQILVSGESITGHSPRDIVQKGVGRAFQIASIFPSFTVLDAITAAVASHQNVAERMFEAFPSPSVRARADELVDLLGLSAVASRKCANISHGDQKLLDIGLALALEPRVLLLDEPTAGMGPEERWQMIRTVHRLWTLGHMTLVFIEHDMDIVFEVAETIHVLRYGEVIASGSADHIRSHPEVIEAYLGKDHAGAEKEDALS